MLWEIESGREVGRLPALPGIVGAIAISSDGRSLAVASASRGRPKTYDVWDTVSGRIRGGWPDPHDLNRALIAFSPNGQSLVSASGIHAVLWDLKTGRQVELRTYEAPIGFVAISPDGRTLVTHSEPGAISLWNAATGQSRATCLLESDLSALRFSPDGRWMASAENNGVIMLWDGKGTRLNVLRGHSGPVRDISFSPDGRTLATAGDDRVVRLWDTESGATRNALKGHTDRVTGLCFAERPGVGLVSGGTPP